VKASGEGRPHTRGGLEVWMGVLIYIFNNIERYLAIIFTAAMVALLFMQVVGRYIFKYSFTWTEELAIICFILSIYTSASLAVTRRQHLRIKILHTLVNPGGQKILDLVCNAIFIVVMLVLGKGMFVILGNLFKYSPKYIATGIPKYVVYGTIWICFYLMVIRLIQDSIKLYKEYKQLLPSR
jgi:TRAP-type C4-dicarboxylate transport system permease small subunit